MFKKLSILLTLVLIVSMFSSIVHSAELTPSGGLEINVDYAGQVITIAGQKAPINQTVYIEIVDTSFGGIYFQSMTNTLPDGSFKFSIPMYTFKIPDGTYLVKVFTKAGDYKASGQLVYEFPYGMSVYSNYSADNVLTIEGDIFQKGSYSVFVQISGPNLFNYKGQTKSDMNGHYSLSTNVNLTPGSYDVYVYADVPFAYPKAKTSFVVEAEPIPSPTPITGTISANALYTQGGNLSIWGDASVGEGNSVTVSVMGTTIGFREVVTTDADGHFSLSKNISLEPGSYRVHASVMGTQISTMTTLNVPKPPVIFGSILQKPNQYGWFNSDVTIHFDAYDPDPAYEIIKMTPDIVLTTEGIDQRVWGQALSSSGFLSRTSVSGINIDKTAPEINVSSPLDGAEYILNQDVKVEFSFCDTLSGIEKTEASVESGASIDTSSVGVKTIEINAVDKAGNVTTKTITYYVKYKFSGLQSPFDIDSAEYKSERSVPLKFSLTDNTDNIINSASAKVYLSKIVDGVEQPEIEAVSANGSSIFQYDELSSQYVFVLKTEGLTTGTWKLKIKLDDMAVYTYDFLLLD